MKSYQTKPNHIMFSVLSDSLKMIATELLMTKQNFKEMVIPKVKGFQAKCS